MTREEAVNYLTLNKPSSGYPGLCEAIDMAIAALRAPAPSMPEPSPARAGYPYTEAGDAVMAQRFPAPVAPPDETGDVSLRSIADDIHDTANPVVAPPDYAVGGLDSCDGCNEPTFDDPLIYCHECARDLCPRCWPEHERHHDEGRI